MTRAEMQMANGSPAPPPLSEFPHDHHHALLLAVDDAEDQYEHNPCEETLLVFEAAVEALDEFYDLHGDPE